MSEWGVGDSVWEKYSEMDARIKELERELRRAREGSATNIELLNKAESRAKKLEQENTRLRAAVENLWKEWMASPERGLDAIPALLESVLWEEG